MDDFWFGVKYLGAVFLICVVMIGSVIGFVALTQHNVCETYASLDAQHNYYFDFWAGCLVQLDNGRWIDATDYQQIQLEEGK